MSKVSFDVGSFAGSFLGSTTGTRAGMSRVPFLEEKPGMIAKMMTNSPIMGDTWRDTKIKEMYFEDDVRSTLWGSFIMSAIVLCIIALIVYAVSGSVVFTLFPLILLAVNYWYTFAYQIGDWQANKNQIINSMVSAFDGDKQQLNATMASNNYLTDLVGAYSANPNRQTVTNKLDGDLRGGNNIKALGVWMKFASQSS